MGRKCSHCGHNGHNSRTCNNSRSDCGVMLFGVQLQVASSSMKKCLSMDCLSPPSIPPSCSSSSPSSFTSSTSSLVSISENNGKLCNGYLSDVLVGRQADRKKGVPWSEEEHRVFLVGLEKHGKGDWRGISRSFVTTRTPTQVASHAQKYFLRQNSLGKKKCRTSLFDAIEGFGQGCNATELPFSSDMHVTSLPLNSIPQGVNEKVKIDLNINGQGADQQHSCLNLMSVCPSIMTSGLPSKLSSGLEEPHVTNHQLPELELKISS